MKKINLPVVVHGDDFTILGNNEQFDWSCNQMQSGYALKVRGRLGPGMGEDKSIKVLNRVKE